MAPKAATFYLVDLGSTLADCHNGRVESDFDFGMRYVWDKLAGTLLLNRKTDVVGVIGFRTKHTRHRLDHDEYANICVMRDPNDEQFLMSDLKKLQRDLQPSDTEAGDAISAIVVALDMIHNATIGKNGKPGAFDRKIVVLTDGQGLMDSDGLEDIAAQFKTQNVQLVVIGIDFDDAEYGFKEEDKSEVKRENEETLRKLVEACNGVYGTAEEAIHELAIPEPKMVKPYTTYTGKLSLGDWEKYPDSALYIDIKRYSKTTKTNPASASIFVPRATNRGQHGATSSHEQDVTMADVDSSLGDLAPVKSTQHYVVNSENGVKGKLNIDRELLSKGYEYGRTVVPINESEETVTKLETLAEFTIIGFIPSPQYERYLNMKDSRITIAEPTNDIARMSLSSLIHSLQETDSYAVARIVLKDGQDPQIILLAPLFQRNSEENYEALVDIQLPFAEDVRTYRFPPLDRVITTSGATVKTHRNLPTDDLTKAMSDFVDSMDLSTLGGIDENGKPEEYMAIDDTVSPVIHQISHSIRRHATHPDEPVDGPKGALLKYSVPPRELVSKSASKLNALEKAADLKKVPLKAKGRSAKEAITPLSGLNLAELLGPAPVKPTKISLENAVPEFKRRMEPSADSTDAWLDAIKQLGEIIRGLVKNSTGDASFLRAIELLKVMRSEIIDCELPESYNTFIRRLKNDLLNDTLGPNMKELWYKVRYFKLGLIADDESEFSKASEADAKDFLNSFHSGLPSRTK